MEAESLRFNNPFAGNYHTLKESSKSDCAYDVQPCQDLSKQIMYHENPNSCMRL